MHKKGILFSAKLVYKEKHNFFCFSSVANKYVSIQVRNRELSEVKMIESITMLIYKLMGQLIKKVIFVIFLVFNVHSVLASNLKPWLRKSNICLI